METPKFKHNCPCCTFLGNYKEFDLYHCEQVGIPTVIARYGENGDYCSGMEFGKENKIPELGEAYRRAKELGLCT